MKNQNNKIGVSIAIIITLIIVNVYEFLASIMGTHMAQNNHFFRAWADAYYEFSFEHLQLSIVTAHIPILIAVLTSIVAWVCCKNILSKKALVCSTVSAVAMWLQFSSSAHSWLPAMILLAVVAIWLISFAVSVVLMIIDMIKYKRSTTV